jgi:hypothetical protein
VITYFVADETMKVTEPPIRNSGFTGGVFLSRRSIKNERGETIPPQDLCVGKQLQILKHRFILYESNDATLRWMEDKLFPQSNFYEILSKIRPYVLEDALSGQLAQLFVHYTPKAMKEHQGFTTKEGLQAVLQCYNLAGDLWTVDPAKVIIVEHELITIVRAVSASVHVVSLKHTDHNAFSFLKLIQQIIAPTDEFL